MTKHLIRNPIRVST